MPKRSSKQPSDPNQLAASVVARATGVGNAPEKPRKKNPAAVALGRRGGLKGGKARAASLSATERREIARKAAVARWDRRVAE